MHVALEVGSSVAFLTIFGRRKPVGTRIEEKSREKSIDETLDLSFEVRVDVLK